MESTTTNWEDLPLELLQLVAQKVPEICDFIRFRAVCKKWRTSIAISELGPQFPWILMPLRCSLPFLQLYSITSQKIYNIPIPESSTGMPFEAASFFAHKYGYCRDKFSLLACEWLHQSGNRYISLLNPFNNSEVLLHLSNCPQLSNDDRISPQNFEGEDFVLFSNEAHQLTLHKPNNGYWECIGRDSRYMSVYLKGLVFTIDITSRVTNVIDISSRKVVHVVAPPEFEEIDELLLEGPFLVESSGEIYIVCYNHHYEMESYKCYLHRLEIGNSNKQPCWVEMKSIDNQIFFFDFIEHRSFSLRTDDFPGLKGNCIYFIAWTWHTQFGADYKIIRHDIEHGENMLINCPFKNNRFTWFIPSLNYL